MLIKRKGIAETAGFCITDVQSQGIDYLSDQGAGVENFHFVVEIAGHAQHPEILHGGKWVVDAAFSFVILFDQHRGIHIVDRGLIAQVDPGSCEAENQAGHKPGPVHQVFKQNRFIVNRLFVFSRKKIIVFFVAHDNFT